MVTSLRERPVSCSGSVQWMCAVGKTVVYFALVNIFVSDPTLANRPPKFLIDGQTEIVLRLKEGADTPAGSLIYRLRGVDPDGDTLTFGVREQIGHDVLRIETIGVNEANVYLKKELDREVRDEYALVLTLTDGHLGDGNFITQSLLLLVEDVNDNEPIFKPYQSSLVVLEDSGPGILTTVEATDSDEGPYGQVVYSLQELDGETDLFSVSTINGKGVIRLVGRLDYEKKFLYQLRVLATDRSNNERINTATAAILVKVQDVEDQPPEFVVVSPVTRVSEDAPVGTSVLQVRAVDGDRGVNNRILYSVTKGGEGVFDIDAHSGFLYTTTKLDRESTTNSNGAYIIEIMAQEESRAVYPAPSVRTEVTIILMDVNDETPTFRSKMYACEVNENAPANTPLTFLGHVVPQVYDFDQGNNGTFDMLIEDDEGIFEVTPRQGINEASFLIRVKDSSRIDFEKMSVINFTLVAKETVEESPKSSRVPVTVFIRDMNDNFPEFTKPIYEVWLPENSRVGTVVVKVQAHDPDSGDLGTKGIRYTNLGGSVADLLSLDPISGVITIKEESPAFDRELVSRHYLTIEARDNRGQGNRNSVQLILNIEDVNDNTPQFVHNKYEARLLENQSDFDSPLIVEARDLDLNGTMNSQVHYSIVEWDASITNFTVDPTLGLVRPSSHIDFETLARIQGGPPDVGVRTLRLILRAHDLGSPSLYAEVPLLVYVQDINDNQPYFEHEVYEQTIPEDLRGGSTVLQVKATDEDASAPNNQVVYRIQSGAGDKFVIDPTSGILSVANGASLDPDGTEPRTTHYSMVVVALDGGIGGNQMTATTQVQIDIQDVNNKLPVLVDPGTVRVLENTKVGQFVHRVVATDPDEKSSLRFSIDRDNCEARSEEGTIIKPSEFDFLSAFELNAVDGLLRVVRLLDRERVEVIRLAIRVEDTASVSGKQITSGVLTIIVEDENDNNPMFRKPFYRRFITENSQLGVLIVNVVADDADKNRTITYSLEGSAKMTELVHLDQQTGEMVVANRIDHEQTPWLNMTVRATDSGIPPRSALVDVFVQVIDENDNNPYFVGNITNVTLREDTPIGAEVTVIEASDADSGDYGKITFLLDRISSLGKFQINPETGMLNVSDRLDREQQSSYMLIVEAWDNYQFGYSSGESRNAFKQIGVTILDVNDEPPVMNPLPESCVMVTEFLEPGETVYTLKASDADDPNTPNGWVSFSILAGNDQELFEIEPLDHWTARLYAQSSLKAKYGNYTLAINVQDLGAPPNFVVGNLNICVTDFNDNAPQFISPPQNITIRIPENATVGSPVITVTAIDADVGPNAAVRYRLKQDNTGDWSTFSVDQDSGLVSLRLPLDRETQKLYQIRVEAYDHGTPTPLSSDLDLTIYVKNVNDYQPQFLIEDFPVNFTEHIAPGKERRLLPETVDRDEVDDLDDPRTPVCYFIVAGNDEGFFNIEPLSHEITVAQELDREEAEMHLIMVKASEDCVTPPQTNNSYLDYKDSTVLRVVIFVNDINDNAPQFVKEVFTGGVTTDADFGSEFMQVRAIDADFGRNAEIQYYMIGQTQMTLSEGMENIQQPPFLVDVNSGIVSLNFDPQKGMKGYFDFKVVANDTGGLSDMARVFIYLLREDQRVRFVLRQHPVELREKIDVFREVLGNVTGAIVNVDEVKVHETMDGRVDKTRSDLYLHFVDRSDHSIMDVSRVLRVVDQSIEHLDSLFKEFNVLDTQAAEAVALVHARTPDSVVWLWLVGTTVFLGLMLVVVISICLSQRASYKRQLKAATITAFGSADSDMTRVTGSGPGRLPNTNLHSTEGSNPIWMQAYENEWYKEDDSMSQTSERDSLDENAVVSVQTQDGGANSSCNSQTNIIKPERRTVKEQNDLNSKSGVYHQNLYQHLDKLSNPLIAKKLETTEL
ncbi:cadherin-23 isoform X2 [Homalodisca vitripennis]|uniref:cadherin-23 isoform X2 n=1 Tax=Homalodisca vitripennis TaxID=197043 RepID=UPI001EEB1CA9|nr:cadherin-23 isoform X2 [Homalodisca vitripennis]